MSALGVLVSASSRQRLSGHRPMAWILAVAGPVLLTVGTVPVRSTVGLAFVLFAALLAVVAVSVIGGARPAMAVVVMSVVPAALVLFRPLGGRGFHPGDDVALVTFALVGVGLAVLVDEFVVLAEERGALLALEAALRRVATFVARGAAPEEVFAAVVKEIGQVLPVDFADMGRYEPGGRITFVAAWGRGVRDSPVGTRWTLDGKNLSTIVFETGGHARLDCYHDATGPLGAGARERSFRSAVGTPIIVEGRLWGVVIAGSTLEDPLPADTEARLADFTELLATAVANAESRCGLARLADAQAALRRVAMLVARGTPSEQVIAAVVKEVGSLLPVDYTQLGRYEPDGTVTFVATWGRAGPVFPAGTRLMLTGKNLPSMISKTGRPARIDSYADASDPLALALRARGVRWSVGTPIIVEGRLWGLIAAGSMVDRGGLSGTEERLADFTELVATAIANAENRAALSASRARVVAAADETRRRIERDLHDGAQQQLVTLGLGLIAAQAAVPRELGEVHSDLSRVAAGLASLQNELREIARGIHPAILTEGGLGPALKTLGRRSRIPVTCDVRASARLPEPVEVAAYYVVSEALANAAKHARASSVQVDVEEAERTLRLSVHDDGAGGATLVQGSGLAGLKDRVEALGGTISVQSPLGAGTLVYAELPLTG